MPSMHFSNSEPTYSIGLAARKVGVSVPGLRLHEREGLILPVRTPTNRRVYSLNDLRIVQTAQHLIHDQGLNFAGIRRLMAFLPCWKIRDCDSATYRKCKVPCITDNPCWSSGEALSQKCEEHCQSCPVYEMAYQIGDLNIYDLTKIS